MKKPALIFLFLMLILFVKECRAVDSFSFWIGGSSHHSAGYDAEEKQQNLGACIGFFDSNFCYMTFENSFHDPGSTFFIQGKLFEVDFGKKWYKFALTNGLIFGIIEGYEQDHIPYCMGYVGLGYKSLPVDVWLDASVIPDPMGSGNYILIQMVRLEVYNVRWK